MNNREWLSFKINVCSLADRVPGSQAGSRQFESGSVMRLRPLFCPNVGLPGPTLGLLLFTDPSVVLLLFTAPSVVRLLVFNTSPVFSPQRLATLVFSQLDIRTRVSLATPR